MAARSSYNTQALRDLILERLQGSATIENPDSVSDLIKDFEESGDLLRQDTLVNDSVLFHAGVSFRVSDESDGARFGMQSVVGNVNKMHGDTSFVEPFVGSNITHNLPYKPNKCAHRPLRETHFFFTIDTHITYRQGKRQENYIYPGDSDRVRDVLKELQATMEFLFETPQGLQLWLVPMRPIRWGMTVDNLLKANGGGVLKSYHPTMDDITELKTQNIKKRHVASKILSKDPYAFRMPRTMEINREEQEKLMTNPKSWIKNNIYSLQYATRIGVRRRYEEAHVLVYMANTHLIIKHYDRIQVDMHNFREAISQPLRPYYTELNHRPRNARPHINDEKSAYIRYTMRDNSLIFNFLEAYIAKARAESTFAGPAEEHYSPIPDTDMEFELPDVDTSFPTSVPTGRFFFTIFDYFSPKMTYLYVTYLAPIYR